MVIGSMFGIEYGTFTQTVRSLTAMGFLVGGLIDVFEWLGVPMFVYQPIIFMVGLGLFMTLLRLDVMEALVTMFGLNILSWVFNMVMFMIIMSVLASEAKKGGRDGGPNYKDSQGQTDGFDDDWQPNDGGVGDPFGPDDE